MGRAIGWMASGLAIAWAQSVLAADSAPEVPDDTIVVTATREAQRLIQVPASVSAFNYEALDAKGAKTIADIVRFSPGVHLRPDTNSVVIRGIGSDAGPGTTGIYIDEVPIQMRSIGFSSDNTIPALFDVDRVEVLRGPQGTLFGAGSEGGAIRYITPAPSLTKMTSYAHGELSAIEHGGMNYEIGGALGGPIVDDQLGFRISAWHRRDGGYIDHVTNIGHDIVARNANHGDVTVLRGALAWSPAPGLTITPAIQYQRRFQNDTDYFWEGISNPGKGVFLNASPEFRPNPDTFYLPSLTIDYRFPGLRLVSATSWFHRNDVTGYDGTVLNLSYYQSMLPAGSPLYPLLTPTGINPAVDFYKSPSRVANQQRTFTQEIRLQTDDPDAALRWSAGLFYQRARQRSVEEIRDPLADRIFPLLFGTTVEQFFADPTTGAPAPLFNGIDSYINQSDNLEEQFAGFLNVRYRIAPTVTLEAGLRYARSRVTFSNFANGPQNGGRTQGGGGATDHPFTPRLSADWQIMPDTLLYGSWSKGYRSGGVNPPVPVDVCQDSLAAFGLAKAPDSYHSDTVESFEIGAKTNLDRHLTFAASVYQLHWHNIQQYVLLPSCSIQYTDNLGQARVRGFDLQFTARPFDGFAIDGSAAYTAGRFTRTSLTSDTPGAPIIARNGDALDGAPWTFALGGQYDFHMGGRVAFTRVDYQYSSFQRAMTPIRDPATAVYDPGAAAPSATHFVSARAGVMLGPVDAALFVNNLLDNAPRIDRTHMDVDTLLFTGRSWAPRTFGISLSRRM